MSQSRPSKGNPSKANGAKANSANASPAAQATIDSLAQSPRLADQEAIAARFIYSLRLIAMHERAQRDPVPELASRLGNVELAAKALTLSHAIASSWPENVRVSCFCSPVLTHDEATIAEMITGASHRDRARFDQALEGFVRADRAQRLWGSVLELVCAEMRSA